MVSRDSTQRVCMRGLACYALGAALALPGRAALSCDLVRAFDACETVLDGEEVVISIIRAGQIEELLRQLPTDRQTKADFVFYLPLWGSGSGEDDRLMEHAIVEELFRRPLLADKLVEAARSVGHNGPFAFEPNTAYAELLVNRGLEQAQIDYDMVRHGEPLPPVFPDSEDSMLLDFFGAWSLLGRPVCLEGITRQNWGQYSAKLGAWWRTTCPEISYDPQRHRFIVRSQASAGARGKPQVPFAIGMWISVRRVPYRILTVPEDLPTFSFPLSGYY